MNEFSFDQLLNLIAAMFLLVLCIRASRVVIWERGLFISLSFVAIVNIAFYFIALVTNVNELYRTEYIFVGSLRSLFTTSVLCGTCLYFLRTRAK